MCAHVHARVPILRNVFVCVCVCVCACLCAFMCACLRLCMHVCTWRSVCGACGSTCMRVKEHV